MISAHMVVDGMEVRAAGADDRAGILDLASRALGWRGDRRDAEFFTWKHDHNPHGASPAWVAVDAGRVVGFRTFLRWQLARGDDVISVVRAVDTATDPDHQGKGIFTRLTMAGVEQLTDDGVSAVFNTPNTQSRPGYLKMGWQELGRPTLSLRPSSLSSFRSLLMARTSATKWSEPVDVGLPALEALADPGLPSLLGSLPAPPGWSTPRTVEHLRWRYGFGPLHYRAIEGGGGLVVFRVRQRGGAREVTIAEWLAPRADPGIVKALVKSAGDYAVGIGIGRGNHTIPLPRQGPIVTWRTLARNEVPELSDLAFSLGDLELL